MNKRAFDKKSGLKKISINKKTIVNLTREYMNTVYAAADASQIGNTCYTGACCHTRDCQTSEPASTHLPDFWTQPPICA